MIFFIAAMLLVGTVAQATNQKLSDKPDKIVKAYTYSQPIIFVEGGVTYHVYPNGEIDYKTPLKRTRKYSSIRSRDYKTAPGHSTSRVVYNRFAVKYDAYGKLKQVGQTNISYNRFNQVRKVGSVLIQYNNRGKLAQIGGQYIYYGKKGTIKQIKGKIHHKSLPTRNRK